jgi:hypothetical protein
MLVFTLTN